ncbi:MAG: hypothetical protein KC503_31360 [Myxococcales bacterium]|nr:hypothetical protein [Myxococcales bacterium]
MITTPRTTVTLATILAISTLLLVAACGGDSSGNSPFGGLKKNASANNGSNAAPGTLGASCQQNDQCNSGLCVGMEGQQYYCSQQCQSGQCPAGYSCVSTDQGVSVCARDAGGTGSGSGGGSGGSSSGGGSGGNGSSGGSGGPSGAAQCGASEIQSWINCSGACSDESCYQQCDQQLSQTCYSCMSNLYSCAQQSGCDPTTDQSCCAAQRQQCLGY